MAVQTDPPRRSARLPSAGLQSFLKSYQEAAGRGGATPPAPPPNRLPADWHASPAGGSVASDPNGSAGMSAVARMRAMYGAGQARGRSNPCSADNTPVASVSGSCGGGGGGAGVAALSSAFGRARSEAELRSPFPPTASIRPIVRSGFQDTVLAASLISCGSGAANGRSTTEASPPTASLRSLPPVTVSSSSSVVVNSSVVPPSSTSPTSAVSPTSLTDMPITRARADTEGALLPPRPPTMTKSVSSFLPPPAPPTRTAPALVGRPGLRSPAGLAPPPLPRRLLSNTSEHRVFKGGLKRLLKAFVTDVGADVQELPRRANGSPVIRCSLLQRLLRGQVELKVCMEGDVSASQMDLKHLTVEQLLTVRLAAIDFLTEAVTHAAHRSFLDMASQLIYEKLTRRLLELEFQALEVGEAPPLSIPQKAEPRRALGRMVVLMLGAYEELHKEDLDPEQRHRGRPPAPELWVLPLDAEAWGDACQVALLDVVAHRLSPLLGHPPDFASQAAGRSVAVVTDRTHGQAMMERLLYWEVAVLDPKVDDVMATMTLKERERGAKREMASELRNAMSKRELLDPQAWRGGLLAAETPSGPPPQPLPPKQSAPPPKRGLQLPAAQGEGARPEAAHDRFPPAAVERADGF